MCLLGLKIHDVLSLKQRILTVADLLFYLFGFSCFAGMLNDQKIYMFAKICTSQTGGQL